MNRDIYDTVETRKHVRIPLWLMGLCFLAGMLVVMGVTILVLSTKLHSQYAPTPQNPQFPVNTSCSQTVHVPPNYFDSGCVPQ